MPKVYLTDKQRAEARRKSLIEFVEGRRKTKKLSQKKLSNVLQVNQQAVSKRLQGTTDISFVEFVLLAKTLEMSDEEILKVVRI